MGHWNYRVVKRSTDEDGNTLDEPVFAVHEAYYKEDDDIPEWITSTPMAPLGSTLDELREVLIELMGHALNKPVLEWEEFAKRSEIVDTSGFWHPGTTQQNKPLMGN